MAVNKLDNSMLDAGTIGKTANKLLQLDGSSKIPAVDGTLLTGIVGFTASASDPVISTNPSGGVGTLWKNTTSGEVYCCTDATAGANVWTNVGAGTGDVAPYGIGYVFQGSAYGYCAGSNSSSANTINKYSYTSDGAGTDVGDLSVRRGWTAGQRSQTHGYVAGGETGGGTPYLDIIDKLPFATDGTATDVGNLATGCEHNIGCSSSTHGYSTLGNKPAPFITDIEKFSFSADGNASDVGDYYGTYRWHGAAASSATYGYVAGGYDPSSYHNQINKWAFATDGTATDVGNLTTTIAYTTGHSSTTYGYRSGGLIPPTSDVIDRWSFSSDGDATDVGNLTVARLSSGGSSSTTHGYCAGGSGPSNVIDKWAFASATVNASDVGDLSTGQYYPASPSYQN